MSKQNKKTGPIRQARFYRKKKEAPTPPLPCLYVDYTTTATGGGAREGEDSNNPFAEQEDAYIDFTIRGVHRSVPEGLFFFHKEEVLPEVATAKKVWIVVVRYTTGNTFGRTHGAWHIFSIRNDPRRAEGEKRMIEFDDKLDNMTEQWNYGRLSPLTKKLIAKKKRLIEGHTPWRGYFERLERVEVLEYEGIQ